MKHHARLIRIGLFSLLALGDVARMGPTTRSR